MLSHDALIVPPHTELLSPLNSDSQHVIYIHQQCWVDAGQSGRGLYWDLAYCLPLQVCLQLTFITVEDLGAGARNPYNISQGLNVRGDGLTFPLAQSPQTMSEDSFFSFPTPGSIRGSIRMCMNSRFLLQLCVRVQLLLASFETWEFHRIPCERLMPVRLLNAAGCLPMRFGGLSWSGSK